MRYVISCKKQGNQYSDIRIIETSSKFDLFRFANSLKLKGFIIEQIKDSMQRLVRL